MNLLSYLAYLAFAYAYTSGTVNPKYYILGPGDKILIVSKSTGMAIKTTVSPEGNVPIYAPWSQEEEYEVNNTSSYNKPEAYLILDIIMAKGLTLQKFADTLAHYTMKVQRREDNFDVMLIEPRNITVEIKGAVYHPGIYTIPANSTVADALWIAGGLKGNACFSKIVLMSKNDTSIVNLSSFEHLNEITNNRSVSFYEKIFVPFINPDSSVYIVGDIVSHPLSSPTFIKDTLMAPVPIRSSAISVPLSEPTSVKQLLNNIISENTKIKVRQNKIFVKRNHKINRIKSDTFMIIPGDSLFIFPLFRGVLVAGEVVNPGTLIPFSEGAPVDYYLSKAGGKSQYAGSVKILRGFRLLSTSTTTIPEDGDIIIVNYSRTKRFSEYISILQGIITLLTLYSAYSK